MELPLKRAPLLAAHQRAGGKLIEFSGWEMPVQYFTITDEHLSVRRAAGIFDISHMGEIIVLGPAACLPPVFSERFQRRAGESVP